MNHRLEYCLIATYLLCLGTISGLSECEVGVPLPWEPNTYVPQGSYIYINCTAESSLTLAWTILLPGRSTLQFSFEASIRTLNDQGFYQLTEINLGMTVKTVRLFINSTAGINGSVVRCDDAGSGANIAQTVLIVYELTPVDVYVVDFDIQRANISWSPHSLSPSMMIQDVNQTYTLMVTSSNTQSQIFTLHQCYFVFIAPEGAPPCEVYNFSITATYVGATYTGAGCSQPSPVLSRMLPSLPDIHGIESSLEYSLEKDSNSSIILTVSFVAPMGCESYPIIGYTLNIQDPVSGDSITTTSTGNSISVPNLTDNYVHSVTLIVMNSQGNISTNNTMIYTTDVQKITAVYVEKTILLQCEFISGSDAQGCLVVLVGGSEVDNATYTLRRNESDISTSFTELERLINPIFPLSCYQGVYGFDVESDGSEGTLAIPGQVIMNASATVCKNIMPTSLPPLGNDRAATPLWVIGVVLVIVLIVTALLSTIILFILKRSKPRSSRTLDSSSCDLSTSSSISQQKFIDKDEEARSLQTMDLYDQPKLQNVAVRTSEDSTNNHKYKDIDCTKLTEDHVYHVLENQSSSKLDPPSPEQSAPIYQEITQILKGDATSSSVANEYACIH